MSDNDGRVPTNTKASRDGAAKELLNIMREHFMRTANGFDDKVIDDLEHLMEQREAEAELHGLKRLLNSAKRGTIHSKVSTCIPAYIIVEKIKALEEALSTEEDKS